MFKSRVIRHRPLLVAASPWALCLAGRLGDVRELLHRLEQGAVSEGRPPRLLDLLPPRPASR